MSYVLDRCMDQAGTFLESDPLVEALLRYRESAFEHLQMEVRKVELNMAKSLRIGSHPKKGGGPKDRVFQCASFSRDQWAAYDEALAKAKELPVLTVKQVQESFPKESAGVDRKRIREILKDLKIHQEGAAGRPKKAEMARAKMGRKRS